VVNALWVWQTADRVLLRIEDHDRQRSRPEFEAAIVEDLDWLGFVPDGPPVRQRDRGDIYSQALETLNDQQLVYGCDCTRAEIARAGLKACATSATPGETLVAQPFPPPLAGSSGELRRGTPKRETREGGRAAEDELRYPGTCRERGVADTPGAGLRVRFEPSVERFVDLRHGPQEQRPSEQCGDLLIRDREGNWTYQFAVTVDDYVQGVTHVIRGDDLLASTGRQLQLARLLGRREPPRKSCRSRTATPAFETCAHEGGRRRRLSPARASWRRARNGVDGANGITRRNRATEVERGCISRFDGSACEAGR
jgi:glutamyl/glutaminyl-tRNA synthetase